MKDIIKCGNIVYEQLSKEKDSRYKSWEYCYKRFQDSYKNKNQIKPDYDNLSLQLAFYLASWGMYRGSSFLLWKDYTIHIPVVKLLFNYDSLWNMQIDDDKNQNLDSFYNDLFKLIDDICEEYNEVRENVYKVYPKLRPLHKNKISDTLVSKIILGTIGCIPAYDRYFVSGVRKTDIIGSLSPNSFKTLIKYYKDNYKDLENLRKKFSNKANIKYSQMKVLDSCFWQYGFEIEDE